MTDVETLNKNKIDILSTLKLRGPSLPVQIAKAIDVQPLFASAFLSELKGEDKIKISNMRVGSSPIYYLAGQEEKLENFVQHLNQREREAFVLLKKEKILEDSSQTPIVRVALRAIKDFAIPLNVKINNETKIFWKFFTLQDTEATELIKRAITGEQPLEEKKQEIQEPSQKLEEKKEIVKRVKKVKQQESDFSKNVKDYLLGRDIEVIDALSEKKKEFIAKIRIDTLFGKQEYYLTAKDKKNISDNDLRVAVHKAQQEKMPAAFFSPGELNKKAREHLLQWKNLIRWEKLNF